MYAKFQLLGICWSRFYVEETATFFGSGPHCAPFFLELGGEGDEFGDNNANKQRQIELKF